MYKISHNRDSNTVEINNVTGSIYGKIKLNEGGSLQELTLNKTPIIQDLAPLPYSSTYASSILFPFANRIKDGAYTFNGKDYKFTINQIEENNALHGLVFDKTFNIIEQKCDHDSASLTLQYTEVNESIGFPYTYSMQLQYVFTKTGLSLKLTVTNTNSKTFPFTVGWHPYFISDNLYDSALRFECNEKLIIGDRNITTGIENIDTVDTFQIKDQQLDDCWILKTNTVVFNTPKYDLTIGSSVDTNFLQAYTPPRLNTIAIEPTTGVSDSFNNKIGLQELKAKESYNITWDLKITNN